MATRCSSGRIPLPRGSWSAAGDAPPRGRFWTTSDDLACGTAAAGRVVAITHLDSDARDFVYDERFDPCAPPDPFPIDGGAIAWSGTGERGWFFARNIAGGIFSTTVSSVRRSGNRFAREGATRTIAQWLVDDARTSADGGTISTLEFGSEGGCRRRQLAFADPFVERGVSTGVDCTGVEQLRVVSGRAPAPMLQRRRMPGGAGR